MQQELIREAGHFAPGWVAAVFLLVMVVLAWVNMIAPRKWGLLAASATRARIPRQAFREEIDLQDRTLLGLLLTAVLVISLFCLQIAGISGTAPIGWLHYLLFSATALAIFVGLVAEIRITAWVFDSGRGLHEYLYHTVLLVIILGLALLPITLMLAYSGTGKRLLMIIGCSLIGLVVSMRWIRAAMIGIGEGIRPMHILLYLCAAEILPASIAVSTIELSLPQ